MKYYKENKKVKDSKQLERHFKGIANSKRIDILKLVSSYPSITLIEISEKLKTNVKTTAEHTRRLVLAGLLNKKYNGHTVEHSISPYGKKMIELCKRIEMAQTEFGSPMFGFETFGEYKVSPDDIDESNGCRDVHWCGKAYV